MGDTIDADVDARSTNCPCCGDQMQRKPGRLCRACAREGCDPDTDICLKNDHYRPKGE
jgi:predicted amidophosphoribosyltransferase